MDALRHFLRKREDPYAGADMAPAIRMCAPAWLITALVTMISLALAPPSRLGGLGWAAAGGLVIVCLVVALRVIRRGARTTPGELLALSYLAVAQIAVLQWLTAGSRAPLGPCSCSGRSTPPASTRRAARCRSSRSSQWPPSCRSSTRAGIASEEARPWCGSSLWFALGMFATHWTDDVRSKRLQMQHEGDEARLSARTDRLTGLENRLAMDEVLAAELHRALVGRQPLSILVADLNGFKEINDRFGHLNGDECLREVATALDAARRGLDRCFRWGGDEFVMVLPDTEHAAAEDLAARLRRTVQTTCLRPDGSPLTITTGTAEAEAGLDADELLGTADLALMSAKALSRAPAPDALT